MTIVIPEQTENYLYFVPRFKPTYDAVVTIKNDVTGEKYTPDYDFETVSRLLKTTITHTFKEGDSYQIEITEGEDVVYRGLIYATSQDAQKFLLTNDKYYWS